MHEIEFVAVARCGVRTRWRKTYNGPWEVKKAGKNICEEAAMSMLRLLTKTATRSFHTGVKRGRSYSKHELVKDEEGNVVYCSRPAAGVMKPRKQPHLRPSRVLHTYKVVLPHVSEMYLPWWLKKQPQGVGDAEKDRQKQEKRK